MAKSKYEEKVKSRFKKIGQWVAGGETELQIIAKLGLPKTSWENYKRQHLELLELLKKGREAKVQNAMELLSTKQVLKKVIKFEQINPKTGKLKLIWQNGIAGSIAKCNNDNI